MYKTGCSTITFRKLKLEESLKLISSLNFKKIDIGMLGKYCPHYISDTGKILQILKENNIEVSTLNVNVGILNHPEFSKKEFEFIKNSIKIAKNLGCYGVTICPGVKLKDWREDAILSAEKIEKLAEYGRKYGVEISIEIPHKGTLVENKEELRNFLHIVNFPNVSYTLDTSHFYYCLKRQPSQFLQFFPPEKIGHIHLRDADNHNFLLIPGKGNIDFKSFFEKLKSINYRRDLILELELENENIEQIKKELMITRRFIEDCLLV